MLRNYAGEDKGIIAALEKNCKDTMVEVIKIIKKEKATRLAHLVQIIQEVVDSLSHVM
jgi:hypothetical protein